MLTPPNRAVIHAVALFEWPVRNRAATFPTALCDPHH